MEIFSAGSLRVLGYYSHLELVLGGWLGFGLLDFVKNTAFALDLVLSRAQIHQIGSFHLFSAPSGENLDFGQSWCQECGHLW